MLCGTDFIKSEPDFTKIVSVQVFRFYALFFSDFVLFEFRF